MQYAKRYVTRVGLEVGTAETHATICLTVETEGMQGLVAPGEAAL
jgi:hypothetical protein